MKRRVRRKKKQRTTICLTVFVLGITFIGAIVCIGILYRKQNTLVSPEELLVEYMNHIPKQEYEEMYAMLNIEASRNISQDVFVKRNSLFMKVLKWTIWRLKLQHMMRNEKQ